LSEPAEFRSATSVHGYQNPQCSVTPSWYEASKTFNPEIKQLLQMQTYNIHLQHIKNTHRHSFNTEIHAGKTASVYIKMANACLYKVFLSTACNKVSALLFSSSLYSQILFYPNFNYNSLTSK
jgi:hypothetical protein